MAEGRAACYFVTQINPWDVAAGILIVREAGGTVSDFQGKDWTGRVSSLVVSNGLVHQSILKLTKREDGDA